MWEAEPLGSPASWILLFSKVRFEPLTHIRLLFLLSWISELRTVTLFAASRWKICIVVAAVAVDIPAVDDDVAGLVGAEGAGGGGADEGDVAAAGGAGDVPVLQIVDDDVLAGRGAEGDAGGRDRGLVGADGHVAVGAAADEDQVAGLGGLVRLVPGAGLVVDPRARRGLAGAGAAARVHPEVRDAGRRTGGRRRAAAGAWSRSCRPPASGWRSSPRRRRPRSRACSSSRRSGR